jgi:hypothetical protein
MVKLINILGLVVVIFGICICSYGFFEVLPFVMGWIPDESPVIPIVTMFAGIGILLVGNYLYWIDSN